MTLTKQTLNSPRFITVIIAACLTGCGPRNDPQPVMAPEAPPAPPPAATVIVERFNIDGHLEGTQLSFSLDTDLPDNTVVMADIYRQYVAENAEGIESYAPPYWEERTTVGALRVSRSIAIDDANWAQDVEQRLHISAVADQPTKILSINQALTISLTVPKRGQSAPLKPNAENLTGRMVVVHEDGHTISAERSFPSKLSVSVKTESTWINPERLEVGRRYRLSEPANVLPEFSTSNPLLDLAAMISIPAGTIFEVRRIEDTTTSRRYLVQAHGETETAGGWINVNNLLHQSLVKVK